jgi:CheY-like chemotaxis protein
MINSPIGIDDMKNQSMLLNLKTQVKRKKVKIMRVKSFLSFLESGDNLEVSNKFYQQKIYDYEGKCNEELSEGQFKVNNKFIKSCGCPSVLIVDDQYINRFIITEYCKKLGILYIEADNGQEAVEIAKEEARKLCWNGFQLILMDLNMPILGGIEASKLILDYKHQHHISQDTQIIAVTAFPTESEKEKWLAAGMSGFRTKPFSFVDFCELLK